MPEGFLLHAPIGLTPVLLFLGALVWFDSYKLIALKTLLAAIAIGGLAAVLSYFANDAAAAALQIDFVPFIRYVSPLVEETLKAAILVYLIRTQRIGLLIDGAIIGFAVGTGFAVVENLYFLLNSPDLAVGVWFIRGFGTAVMHGGATAIFAIVSVELADEHPDAFFTAFGPGLAAAAFLHSLFNHFIAMPVASTMGVIVFLPLAIYAAFTRSESALKNWLGEDFDADVALLEALEADDFRNTRIGRYLLSLRERFDGLVVGDMLCYLQLHAELALRAKGVLLAREGGFDMEVDEETLGKLTELEHLERCIGKTGQLAMQPVLQTKRKDLWQFYVLKQ